VSGVGVGHFGGIASRADAWELGADERTNARTCVSLFRGGGKAWLIDGTRDSIVLEAL